jgi:AraC-like DNA-binding protein
MREVVNVVRRPGFPGVELIQASHSARQWGHMCGAFAFNSLHAWRGRIDYRRRTFSTTKGNLFLVEPGEVFLGAPADKLPGGFRVIEITPQAMVAACRAEGHRAPVHFAEQVVVEVSAELSAALSALERALLDGAEPLEQQSRLAAVAHAALRAVLERAPHTPKRSVPLGHCARLRDILHGSEGIHINLADFARRAGVSQFQLLRTFKRHYGYPPHAYGLHVRVERARQLLQRGFTVAQAAAAGDFTDQSHLTRHFRRIWGVTPGAYANGTAPTQQRF